MNKEENELNKNLRIFDNASFEKVFKDYYSMLCASVFKIVKNRDASEDLVQDVFINFWNKKDTLQINTSIKSYLYRSSINVALNYLEKNKKSIRLDQNVLLSKEPYTNELEENLSGKELKSLVDEAIDSLPPACRTIFILSRENELSYKEIADSLQVSIKTVENQMGKALKILRIKLATYINSLTVLFLLLFRNE